MTIRVIAIAAWLALMIPASAQDDGETRITVQVTAVAGRSVFLNHGSSSGLTIGTDVQLFPADGSTVVVTVRSISTDSARAELPPGTAVAPPIGTNGEADVPIVARPDTVSPRRTRENYTDLPWRNSDDGFDTTGPLLAPVAGTRPEDRPVTWRGRLTASVVAQHNDTGFGSSDYVVARFGSRTTATNLFANAGDLELAFDVDHRNSDAFGSARESESRVRLERLSYTMGLAEDDPYRVQLGRFFSRSVPELGLLDGAEFAARFRSGLKFGVFAGALPRPFPARASGEDVAVHAFVEFQSRAEHRFRGLLALQKSWHRGAADRDLVVSNLFVQPTDHVSLQSNAKFDFYTSGDTVKGTGPRVTEAFTTLRYAPPSRSGASISHSYFEWVESDRREYQDLPIALLADGHVHRVRGSVWSRVTDTLRIRANGTAWEDQSRSGTSWELTAEFDDLLPTPSRLSATIFGVDGAFQSGPGMRVDARHRWDAVSGRMSYTLRRLDDRGLSSRPARTSQSVRIGADWNIGKWNYSLGGDTWFGDDEDAISLSLFAHYRF